MNITIGILAHVDAGKTTLSEQILYLCGSTRKLGRVDHSNTLLDYNPIEKERGITVFSEQASFVYKSNAYYLVDTPGHADFTAEAERALSILDYAILVVSCSEGIQAHTETIWHMLEKRGIPVFIFINKTDIAGADLNIALTGLKNKFSENIASADEIYEKAAELDDLLLEKYLEGEFDDELWRKKIQELVSNRKMFIAAAGSALNQIGITELLDMLELYSFTDYNSEAELSVIPYKVRHDPKGVRNVYLKVSSGRLSSRDVVFDGKVNEIRFYNGEKFTAKQSAEAGELCAVTGLENVKISCGVIPLLSAKLINRSGLNIISLLQIMRTLEDESPELHVRWNETLQEIHIDVMGAIQLEVLKEVLKNRFSADIDFDRCEILYLETIRGKSKGAGHYEPLRHYSEVHIELEEAPRGSGIKFISELSVNELPISWQRLIETHVYEKEHKGVLTGFPLTDVTVRLEAGLFHLKHTEGGDFREATYRAIRQSLMYADNILLEPYYRFKIEVAKNEVGRVMSDIQKMYGQSSAAADGDSAIVTGTAPVYEMMNYNTELMSFTKGRGRLSLEFDGYRGCHNTDEVLKRISYNPESDIENTADSMFCSHGAGFSVKWDESNNYMHKKI